MWAILLDRRDRDLRGSRGHAREGSHVLHRRGSPLLCGCGRASELAATDRERRQLVVLDAGLTARERVLLSGHATVFDPAQRIEGNPTMMKSFPHLLEPSGIVVLIDSDMIVTGSLEDVHTVVRAGRICAYPDPPETRRRWFPEWHDVLELRAPLRHGVCVNAGFVAFSMDHWPDLLSRWWNVCKLVPPDEPFASGTPFNAGDQDVLNALLLSEIAREALVLPPKAKRCSGGMPRVEDFETLACTSAGRPAKILHYVDRPKPWEPSGWLRLAATDYVRLMAGSSLRPTCPSRSIPATCRCGYAPVFAESSALRTLGGANRAIVWSGHRVPKRVEEQLRRARRRLA